jgi:hypothetical protein
MIDEEKLFEYWKTSYGERYKHVKKIVEDEIIPLYNNQINTMISLIQSSLFKMLKAERPDEIYEAISRLNGSVKLLETLVNNLTNDMVKVLTIVLAPKTIIPSESVKS